MTRAVFDASALAPSYLPHDRSQASRRVLEHFEPVILSFLLYEFANVLRNYVRADQLAAADADRIYAAAVHSYDVTPSETFVPAAIALANQHNHSVYDSVYIAAADVWGLPLVTCDKRVSAKFAAALNRPILNLYDLPESLP